MSKLPSLTGKEVIAALKKAGFEILRIKSSHHFLQHSDGRATVVPMHAGETAGPGQLAKILRDCEFSRDQFADLLQV